MKVSSLLINTSVTFPGVATIFLRLYVTYKRLTKQSSETAHWIFLHLSDLLNYRAPVKTELKNGMQIIVPWHDSVGQSIIEKGVYEDETVSILDRLLGDGMIFLDVGAHVGQYTLFASQLVGDSGGIHSFEPDPITYKWLCANIKMNQLRNVSSNEIALFNENCLKEFNLATTTNIGGNSLVGMPANTIGRKCNVECLMLDDYMEQQNIGRVDCMKMDVEGAELHVLQGATRLFESEFRPWFVMEFSHHQNEEGYTQQDLYNHLVSKEYSVRKITNEGLEEYTRNNSERYFNVIAMPEEKCAAIIRKLA